MRVARIRNSKPGTRNPRPVLHIRKAEPTDVAELRTLAIRIFSETFEADNNPTDIKAYMDEAFSTAKMEAEFNEPGSQFFVTLENETMIGYARVRENPEANSWLGENNIELQRLYVDKPWQGKGVAGELMALCEMHASELKKDWIWLGVWENNFKAQTFYKKHGYTKFADHPFMVGSDKQTDWLMRKALRGKKKW